MNGHVSGAWKYFRNNEGTFSVYPEGCDRHKRFPKIVLAEVFTEHAGNPEFNARLISASPEMYVALIDAVEALRATNVFMCGQGFASEEMDEIIEVIDELLARIDGSED